MGGDRRYQFPSHTTSHTGGWWNNAPKHAVRNTKLAALGIACLAIPIFIASAQREVGEAADESRLRLLDEDVVHVVLPPLLRPADAHVRAPRVPSFKFSRGQ